MTALDFVAALLRSAASRWRGLYGILLLGAALGCAATPVSASNYAWGWGQSGQLGDGTWNSHYAPATVEGSGALAGRAIVQAAVGYTHTVALCSDGTLVAWGSDYSGELGDGGNSYSLVPVPVHVAGTPLEGKRVVAISAGTAFSVALCADGTLAAWGSNNSGQLGNAATSGSSAVPVAVDRSGVLAGKRVVQIASGAFHTIALCSDGTVAGWGNGTSGQLGDGGHFYRYVPVLTDISPASSALAGHTVTSIGAGRQYSMAICSDGFLAGWGSNIGGPIGVETGATRYSPVAVITAGTPLVGRTVSALACGSMQTLALCTDGALVGWGTGYLGDGPWNTSSAKVLVPTAGTPLAGRRVAAIAAGCYHVMALCTDGTLVGWSRNDYGSIGDDSTVWRPTPVAVDSRPLGSGEHFTRVFCGPAGFHTIGVTSTVAAVEAPASPRVSLQFAGANPGRGEIAVRFALEQPGRATIEVFDVVGRRRASRSLDGLSPGAHEARWPVSASLPPGAYEVRLRDGERIASLRAILVR